MKYLYCTLTAFFIIVSLQAQTIRQDDLLGEWMPISIIISDGTSVNLEKDEVILSETMLKEVKDGGQDAEEFKANLAQGFSIYKDIFRVAISEGVITRFEDGEAVAAPFKLIDEAGKYYLDIDGEKNLITLKDGLLTLLPSAQGDGYFTIVLKKIQ